MSKNMFSIYCEVTIFKKGEGIFEVIKTVDQINLKLTILDELFEKCQTFIYVNNFLQIWIIDG
jgi:hypothetical protein